MLNLINLPEGVSPSDAEKLSKWLEEVKSTGFAFTDCGWSGTTPQCGGRYPMYMARPAGRRENPVSLTQIYAGAREGSLTIDGINLLWTEETVRWLYPALVGAKVMFNDCDWVPNGWEPSSCSLGLNFYSSMNTASQWLLGPQGSAAYAAEIMPKVLSGKRLEVYPNGWTWEGGFLNLSQQNPWRPRRQVADGVYAVPMEDGTILVVIDRGEPRLVAVENEDGFSKLLTELG
jgi:hypothetical protein